jgi:hypothetical protein
MSQYDIWTDIEDQAATLGAVATKTFIVPAGKRWLVFGGYAERDVGSTLDIALYSSGDKIIMAFPQVTSGSTNISWGIIATATAQQMTVPIPLKAGQYVKYTWSMTQGTPEVTCHVSEHPKG